MKTLYQLEVKEHISNNNNLKSNTNNPKYNIDNKSIDIYDNGLICDNGNNHNDVDSDYDMDSYININNDKKLITIIK